MVPVDSSQPVASFKARPMEANGQWRSFNIPLAPGAPSFKRKLPSNRKLPVFSFSGEEANRESPQVVLSTRVALKFRSRRMARGSFSDWMAKEPERMETWGTGKMGMGAATLGGLSTPPIVGGGPALLT